MRYWGLLLLAASFALLAAPASGDEMRAARRYVSPSGAFSIAMDDEFDRLFHAGKENVSGDLVVVDFPHMNSMGLATQWGRTIEWLKLDKAVDRLQFDAQASALVDGYLEGRYGAGTFAVLDRGKFRDADGDLVYAFSAKGSLNQMPAAWQGAVLFFDSGVALVSETGAQPATFDSKNGVTNEALVDWAETIRPGG
ncbi:MAG TPA: hypothetical protein VNU97_19910 [Rhizomicrobium sp.]|jgi:hypothetical protein|nr:hypothetical protein [Rhizomicrobium sp.]